MAALRSDTNGRFRPRLCKNAEPRKFCVTSYLKELHTEGVAQSPTEDRHPQGKMLRAILIAASFYTAWTHC
jgi:hypothetical protein